MQVFSERLPIKSFKQDVSALRDFCKGKDKVIVTSLLAPGTCDLIEKETNVCISYRPSHANVCGVGKEYFNDEYRATVVIKNYLLEKDTIDIHVKNLVEGILCGPAMYKEWYSSVKVDALLIAIGQAGSNPIVKLLTDAYCLHRFYSGEKEI